MLLTSTTAAPATSPTAPISPTPPRGTTETEYALQFFTPESRKLVTPRMLNARIGQQTLAGALNDQVRFRVDRTGTADQWTLQPDSPAAAAVLQSKAGPALIRQLTVGLRASRRFEDVSNLQGIILARDAQGVVAGNVMSWLDSTDRAEFVRAAEHSTKRFAAKVRGYNEGLGARIATAGAWNGDGWITYMPDVARGVLAAANAYEPAASEPRLRSTERMSSYLARVHPHEVEHSISRASPTAYVGTARWMEEGTADVLANNPVFRTPNRKAAGLSAREYRNALRRQPALDLGWQPYQRPVLPPAEESKSQREQARNYAGGQRTLTDLVRLAGVDFRTTAGRELAGELLQRKSMRFTPGVITKALIERYDLDPAVYERLRQRIKGAVDVQGGAAAIAREFGMARH